MIFHRIFLILLLLSTIQIICAQEATLIAQDTLNHKHSPLKDTVDHKFDVSNYLINMHGVLPLPSIITEPALGNFGVALALLYIQPKKNAKGVRSYRYPDITGVLGLYTLNNTWGAGAFRQGSFPAIGLRYRVVAAYADIKVDFYRDLGKLGEQKFLVNLKPVIAMIDLSENLFRNKLFIGFNYTFMNMSGKTDLTNLPDTVFDPDNIHKNSGNISIYAEWDNRNSIFTPDRGMQFKASYGLARTWTLSDYNFDRLGVVAVVYMQPLKRWVCGLKANIQAITDGAPFYLYPFLYMRGIPAMRYQGNTVLSFDTEQRVDITNRWSILGFAGTGRTFSNSEFLKDESWHWAGGAGFRYLLSRIFKLRAGVDIAAGPDTFAYYIVLGHYWNF
jgi:hypothetical protein